MCLNSYTFSTKTCLNSYTFRKTRRLLKDRVPQFLHVPSIFTRSVKKRNASFYTRVPQILHVQHKKPLLTLCLISYTRASILTRLAQKHASNPTRAYSNPTRAYSNLTRAYSNPTRAYSNLTRAYSNLTREWM
jgi:hypothetical protein